MLTDVVAVAPEGRVTPLDAGLWSDEQADAWRAIVDDARAASESADRRAPLARGPPRRDRAAGGGVDRPLRGGGWPLVAASALPYTPRSAQPRALSRADMDAVRDAFVAAAERAARAGFDLLELHMGHGYLLGGFISPLSNRRDDEHGGALEARLRFPLEVLAAVRAAWPAERPLAVCLNGTDFHRGGIDEGDVIAAARALREAGCDLVHVVGGQTTPDARPSYRRYFLAAHSERIRSEAGVPTLVGGRHHVRPTRSTPCSPAAAPTSAWSTCPAWRSSTTRPATGAIRGGAPPAPPGSPAGWPAAPADTSSAGHRSTRGCRRG